MERETPARDARVLERPAHQPGGGDRNAVVAEGRGARVGELGHLGQLRPGLSLRDRGDEADRHLGLRPRRLDQRTENRRGVDDRVGVRHREDRAEPAGRSGPSARGDVLLVLPPRGSQVHVRVDEGRREHEPVRLDDPVLVCVNPLRDLGDRAAVDPHFEPRVDPFGGIEHAGAADDEIRGTQILLPQHHATSAAASACTPTGPPVSTS